MNFLRYLTILSILFCLSFRAHAQTTLTAGDVVLVGYNSDDVSSNDDFSFLLLTAVSSGTTIHFTDFGWCSGVDITGFQTPNPCGATTGAVSDGAITWTATSALPCGTQVRVQCKSTLAASTGTVTGLQSNYNSVNFAPFVAEYMSLAIGGDQVFAFQGSLASPTLIAGMNMNGAWDATLSQCLFTSSQSTLPAALSSTSLAITPEVDNAVYNCTVVANTPANLRTAIFNVSNWNVNDATPFTLPLSCTFSCNACTAPAVSAHPPNRTICANGNTTFDITATGTGLTYQWQVNTGSGFTNLSNGAPYSGVTTNTLTITGATAGMSGYLYRCAVTGTCGSATSNNGTLTVSTVTGSTVITNVACFGGTNGAINLTPSGGTGPYTFNWGGGITTEDRTVLAAGSYSVTITDNNSCTGTVNATVTQPAAAISGSTVITNVACNGGTNGAINLTPSGGTSPYTYNWGGGITTEDRTGLSAGNYSVTITDANSCTGTVNATVTQPTAVSGSTVITNVACNGGSNGAINLTPSGGTSPYTFNWGGGITTEDRTGLAAGNYSVTITDANSCTGTVNATVSQPAAAVSGSTVITNVSCNGGSSGAINLTPSGGTSPYTFDWGGGITTEDRTGLAAGNYSVTITDANSCTGTVNATVTQPTAINTTVGSQINATCSGINDGSASITPSGGTSPYTYSWSPSGGTAATATGLAAATYTVTVTDDNGCTATRNYTITEITTISTATGSQTNVSCNGGSNGSASVTPSGGTAPYTYFWTLGAGSASSATGLAAGSYTVTVTDDNGCTATRNYTITEPSAISTATGSQTNVSCNGGSNGSASITPSGGTAPYTYSWSPSGGTAATATGLAAGTYTVTVTDDNGCTATRNYTITEPSAISTSTGSQTNVSCNGGNDGAATVSPSGGTPAYTYSWSPSGGTAATATGLVAGTYTVTVTDANGCIATRNYTITQPTLMNTLTGSQTNVSCNGGSNGTASITPSGGTSPYTYSWSPGGGTAATATGLSAGLYTVTVTDDNGCTATRNYTITQPPVINTATGSQTNLTCNGATTGSASITPSGGTSPYTYSWSPSGGTAATATGLAAGNYTVTVTDANGCIATRNYTLTQPSAINTATGSQTNATCGASNGSASITPSGGMAPYTYSWSPSGGTAATATGLAAGAYTITVTDANSCTATRIFTITDPGVINTSVGSQTNVSCNGGSNGSASITPSAGTAPYTYSWAPGGGTAATATGLVAGTYTVTVTDDNGCTATRNYTITEPSAISTATGSQTNVTCNGAATGSATISPSGGAAPYTYIWSPGGGTAATAGGLAAGTYLVVVTDDNGCQASRFFTITQPTAINTSVGSQTNIACNGASTGSATISPSGGTAPYTYLWSPSGGTAATATGLAAGNYSVTITDDNGCTATRNYTITQPSAISTATGSQTNVSCNGGSNGSASVTPSGGTAPYTYSWSPGGGTASAATGLTAGAYTITVTDDNGCTATRNYTITQPSAINTATGSQTNVSCNGGTNGSATISPSGGTAPYTYSWSPSGGTGATASGLAAGTYTVTVTDANSCIATRTFTISQPAALTATGSQTNVLCNAGATGTATVTPSGGTAPYTYLWSPSGGTAATATGLIAGAYSVTVTDNNGCATTRNYTITQPPALSAVSAQINVSCNGGTDGVASVTPSGGTPPYTYSWSPSGGTAATATGLAAGSYTVTVIDNNGCTATRNYTITQPAAIAVYDVIGGGAYCSGGTGVTVGLNNSDIGVNYQLYNGASTMGSAVAGTGSALSFGLQTAAGTYTVVATHNTTGCQATMSASAVVIVNPIPDVNTVSNQVLCNGASTTAINFSGAVSGTAFSWTNNTTSIGLAASGTGDISSFTAANTGTAPVTGTIIVTPSANGCTGATGTFTITVNPTPTVNPISSQTLCNTAATTAVNFSGTVSGTTYSWTNNTASIGLGASGTGNIASFTAANTGSAPVTATITVTPSANGCSGTAQTFTITVNPTPSVTAVSNQTYCNGASTAAINFGGSAVSGTAYNWVNNTTSIGLAASGTGNIPAFTAANSSNAPVTATITVTPVANSCPGAAQTFTITVNPTPQLGSVASQTRCNGANTAAINFSGPLSGTTFGWTNNTPSIGLAASGTGNIASFATVNTTNAPVIASITVTPSANGCTGLPGTFTITVNPTPTVNPVASQTLCNGDNTSAITFSGAVSGTNYNWSNNTTSIGLAAAASGDIASFTAINTGSAPVIATVDVVPSANGCLGATETFTITVNPTPTVNTVSNQDICNGSNTTAINFTSPVSGSVYNWTNNNTSIGLAANGTGNIAAFTTVNATTIPAVATITVTASANGCTGPVQSFTITVNPVPVLTSTLTPADICNNTQFSYTPTSATPGTAFTWNRAAVPGISNTAASGNDNPLETLVNTTPNPVTVTYVYTVSANGCSNSQNVSVVVNPTPELSSTLNHTICSEDDFAYTPTSLTTGTAFTWSRAAMPGITPATGAGTGNIFETLANTTASPINVVYVYTLTANGCSNTEQLTLLVNPRPQAPVMSITSPGDLCMNTMYQNFGAATPPPAGASYSWTAQNAIVWAMSTDNQNALVHFPNAGTSEVILTTTLPSTGCESSAKYTVQVGTDASQQPEIIYHNGRFVCLFNDADTYRWGYDDKLTLDSTIVSNETNQDYLNLNPDFNNRYYWVITSAESCIQKSYYNKPTGLEASAIALPNVRLYPNPAGELINIGLEGINDAGVQFIISDMAGRTLKTISASGPATQVDISSFAQGFYSVACVKDGNKITTVKFVKH